MARQNAPLLVLGEELLDLVDVGGFGAEVEGRNHHRVLSAAS